MLLIYGATGYTGRLVAQTCVQEGLSPVLAGRSPEALRELAEPLGCEVRVGGLEDVDLDGASVLINCAGPFSKTAQPLISRCVDAGVHYLDLAGEVNEHLAATEYDRAARGAVVLLLPGAAYGIVASDCLAAHVAPRVPDVQSIEVALKTVGGVSRGSAEVVLGSLRSAGVRREAGELVEWGPGAATLRVDFGDGDGPTTVVGNPWRADLVASVPTAPGYETFMAFPAPVRALMRIPHGGLLRAVASRLPEGPSEDALTKGRSAVWARATGADGSQAEAVLNGPDAYVFTGLAAAACARRALGGHAPPGLHTPAGVWGPELLDDIPGVELTDR